MCLSFDTSPMNIRVNAIRKYFVKLVLLIIYHLLKLSSTISRILFHIRIGIHFLLGNRKYNHIEIPVIGHILRIMFGFTQIAVFYILTLYCQSISDNVIHAVREVALETEDAAKTLCVTVNPVSAYGWKFDKDEFLFRMKEAVDVPVINVKEELA